MYLVQLRSILLQYYCSKCEMPHVLLLRLYVNSVRLYKIHMIIHAISSLGLSGNGSSVKRCKYNYIQYNMAWIGQSVR